MERAVHWGGDFKRAGTFRLPAEVEAYADRAALDVLASQGEYEAARELVADAVIAYYSARTGRDYRAGLPVTGSSSSEMLLEDAALARSRDHGLSDFARSNKLREKTRKEKGESDGDTEDTGGDESPEGDGDNRDESESEGKR